jgi:hypothetical protein
MALVLRQRPGHTRDGRSGPDENTACELPSCGHSFNITAADKVLRLGLASRLPGDRADLRHVRRKFI